MAAETEAHPGDGATPEAMPPPRDRGTDAWLSRALRSPEGNLRWSAVLVAGVVALALALVAWTWATSPRPGSTDAAPAASAAPGPVLMTRDQLVGLSASVGHALYWAGPRGQARYEVTTVGRDVYLRYLPTGETAGSVTPHLTVGTYEKPDAHSGLVAAAKVAGARSERLPSGALVVQPAGKATSAYVASPGAALLVEAYDPTPGAAYRLAVSGAVQPVS
jgi:hypothetical protein